MRRSVGSAASGVPMKTIRMRLVLDSGSFCGRGFSTRRRADFFCRHFRLQKQQQIIAAARFRIGAGHVEAAEWMHAYERAGAFAIQVQISDMKLATRSFKF